MDYTTEGSGFQPRSSDKKFIRHSTFKKLSFRRKHKLFAQFYSYARLKRKQMKKENTHSHQASPSVALIVGTFNLKNSMGRPGSLPEVITAATERNIQILLLTEHNIDKDLGKEFFTASHFFTGVAGKVAWMINNGFCYEIEQTPLTDRITVLKIPQLKLALVGIYALADSETHTKDQRKDFYKDLPGLVRECIDDDYQLILLGDWNVSLPPELLSMWEYPTHIDNHHDFANIKLTSSNMEVATEALTAIAKLHLEVTTFKEKLPKDFHTFRMDVQGATYKTIIDHVAMTEDLSKHISGHFADWPVMKNWNPNHALVFTKTTLFLDGGFTHHHKPKVHPKFSEFPKDDHLCIMADNLIKKALAAQKNIEENLKKRHKYMETIRKHTHEEAEVLMQDHMEEEMQSEQTIREAKLRDKNDFLVELATEMVECIAEGNLSAVFAIAKGKTGQKSKKAISNAQKLKMDTAHKNTVAVPHENRLIDESKWIFPEANLVPVTDPTKEWETYHVDGSFYGSGEYSGSMGFAMMKDGTQEMIIGPVVPCHDGTPSAYTAEVWVVVEVLERSDKNQIIHGDCESVQKMIDDIELHAKNDFESVSHSSWWRRIYYLTRGVGRELIYKHTASHCGNLENEIVDKGAKFAARHLMKPHILKFPPGPWANVTNEELSLRVIEEEFLLNHHMKHTGHFPMEETSTTVHPENRQEKLKSRPLTEITREKVAKSLSRLAQRETAAGEDGVLTKTYTREDLLEDLYILLKACWDNKRVPSQFKRDILCAIPKKDGPITPSNYRGITLINTAAKVLTKVILDSLDPLDNNEVPQYGYTRGYSTTDAIHIARNLIRVLRMQRQKAVAIFIDIEKAYDNLNQAALEAILRGHGFSDTAIALIKDLWEDEIVMKYQDNTYGSSFTSKRGVKQGDVLSPFIFILCLNTVLRGILNKHQGVVLYRADNTWKSWEPSDDFATIKALLYADDILIMCKDTKQAQKLLDEMNEALQNIGLRISPKKTKAMIINEEYIDEHDTHEGHNARVQKLGCSATGPLGRPWAEYVAVSGPREAAVLYAPVEKTDLRCPHPQCDYVARNELANPWNSMKEHLQQHHETHCYEVKKWEWGPVPEELWRETKDRDWSIQDQAEFETLWVRTQGMPDEAIQFVSEFPYLGSILSNINSLESELNARIAKATRAFYCFPHGFWRNQMIPMETRILIFEACVLSILTYAAESWVLTEPQENKINSVYMRFLREITGDRTFVYDWQPIAPLVETVIYAPPNDYILEKANAKTLTDILRQKRLRQLGTTIRRDPNSFTSQATLVVGIPAHRGPSAMSWLQRVAMDMEKLRISPHMAKDPIAWRKLIKAKRRGDLNNIEEVQH